MRIVDLSRELYHRTPTYPGQPPIIHGVWKTHEEAFAELGNVQGNSVMFFSMPDHGGTHIDAPRHFGKDATPIDEYPLEYCYVKGICIDLRHIAPKAEITPADLQAAVAKSGTAIPKRGTVLLCTGHHERTFPTAAYSTDNPGSTWPPRSGWKTGDRSFRHRLHAARADRRRELAGPKKRAWSSTSRTSRACAIWNP